jgi:predicted ATPase
VILRTLGGLRLDGASCDRRKPLLLVAYLALEGLQPRDRVARLFWPAATDPRNRLSVALSRLRKEAPGCVDADSNAVSTRVAHDVAGLRDALERRDRAAIGSSYAGAFLEGVDLSDVGSELEGWILEMRETLGRQVRTALLDAAERDAATGAYRDAARTAERAWRLPGAPPATPETLRRLHDLLVAGDSADAAPLRGEAAEIGLELPPGRARARASVRSSRPAATLPRSVTSFVGRDAELLELGRILGHPDHPLVTLLGPGGVGKTRLALALAQDALATGRYEGGVHFVPLEEVAGAEQIPGAVAATLGVVPRGDESPLEALERTTRGRPALWILDNLEHLADDPEPVAALLHACRDVALLATSRARLRLEEESAYPLAGLPTPRDGAYDEQNEAIRLFLDRARRSRLDYRPDPRERAAIADIVTRVDGMPLAIELAAHWVEHDSAERAAAALHASFDALASRSRNVDERHRTLRASFEVSWRHLDERQQDGLRRVTVFHGGFDAEAAERIAGVTRTTLLELVARSLLTSQSDGRFGLHPLTRAYAEERLRANEALHLDLQRRHAGWYLDRARAWDAGFYGAHQAQAQASFERERENVAVAERWALRHDPALALDLVDARWRYWRFSGRFAEGRTRALAAIEAGREADPERRARALHVAGAMAYRLADFDAARRHLNAALAAARRAGDDGAELRAIQTLGNVAVSQRRTDEAEALFHEALAKTRTRGDTSAERSALTGLGEVAGLRDAYAAAEERFEQVLALARADGVPTSIATSLFNLAMVAREKGDLELARRRFEEALTGDADVGDRWGVALALHQLGVVAYQQGRPDEADERYREALSMYRDMGDAAGAANVTHDLGLVAKTRGRLTEARSWYAISAKTWIDLGEPGRAANALWGLARVASAEGRHELAARLWGAEETLRDHPGGRLSPDGAKARDDDRRDAEQALGPRAFHRERSRGRRASAAGALEEVATVATD